MTTPSHAAGRPGFLERHRTVGLVASLLLLLAIGIMAGTLAGNALVRLVELTSSLATG